MRLYSNIQAREIPFDHRAVTVQRLIAKLCGWKSDVDAPGRDIWVTPIYGEYERPAGAIITINGSPSRGMLWVKHFSPHHIYYDVERHIDLSMEHLDANRAFPIIDFLRVNGFHADMTNFDPAVCRRPAQVARMLIAS